MAWAVQIGYTSPTLRSLGISDSDLSYAWLAAPITGIFIQPLVGVWSDLCASPLGRRRPFLLAGTVLSVCGLIAFSNAQEIGDSIGGTGDSGQAWGLGIALVAMWMLDAAINMAQGPQRALLTDVVPPGDIALGNAFFAANNGVGKALGYGLGALSPFRARSESGQVRALYSIAAVAAAATMAVTCFTTRERRQRPPPRGSAESAAGATVGAGGGRARQCGAGFRTIVRGALRLPPPIVRAFITQFWAYFAWFAVFIYGSTVREGSCKCWDLGLRPDYMK
ncbi:unnamed protein product [Phaeothamnion confervicola]